MEFISLQPFIPSGSDFEASKHLFQELGFKINWDVGDYAGFQRDNCQFILQKFDNHQFAENLMINVRISNANEFYKEVVDKKLTDKYEIKLGKPTMQPYGKEVNIIDIAGVCWHFVE
ncbi:MAG: hypothetical protein ACJ748_15960 [Flavisolibacter sp.]